MLIQLDGMFDLGRQTLLGYKTAPLVAMAT
jgi:hypothetical protein